MNDVCPHCGVVRDFQLTRKAIQKKNARGKVTKILVKSYSCSTCGFFVKSEETPVKRKL